MNGYPISNEFKTEIGLVQAVGVNFKEYDFKSEGDEKLLQIIWTKRVDKRKK